MEKNKVIPIVLATDDNYALYCYAAIFSLIAHASKEYQYKIYVFETNLQQNSIDLLNSLSCDYVSVKCLNIGDYLKNIRLEASIHLSVETYYRLFIPLVLPMYDKVLYVDTDMIVMEDISKLYFSDLQGKSVGVAEDTPTEYMRTHAEEIGKSNCQKQFNAGLILMDTVQFENEGIREKCLCLLQEDYRREKRRMIFADQDALNVVLEENVFWLDPRWNYQVQYLQKAETVLEPYRDQYVADSERAYIYHFAGSVKPWDSPLSSKAMVFWDTVKQTPLLNLFINNEIQKCQRRIVSLKCFDNWRFPYEEIPFGSKVVLYAAGKIGKAFYEQMKYTQYASVVLWVDNDWENYKEINVKPIKSVVDETYDYIVIAISKEEIVQEAKENLVSLGVDEKKIIWKKYRIV